MFLTFERVKELAQKQGISLNTLEIKLGYSKNTLYSLKKQRVSTERLQEIADYFGVSTDYLLGRTDSPKITTDAQSQTLNVEEMAANAMMFGGRELTDEKKRIIQSIIEGYLKESEK